jgi:Flp pilus assembly protein CpaB
MAAINQARPATTTNIRTPLFILGVALALIAFLVMFAFGLLFANRASTGAQIRVVVAGESIDAREAITPGMLTTTSLPQSALPPGAFTRLADLSGFSAVVAIPKGQVISSNLVASRPDQLAVGADTFLPIPAGWIAISLPTSEQQGVAGYIAQGDYINIFATVNTQLFQPQRPRQVTGTVFTNVHVIRVGPESIAPKQGVPQGIASSITIVMTLCDAQFMDWLSSNSTLKYVLLAHNDYATAEPKPDPACPSTTAPVVVGPTQVEERWHFTRG